MWNCSRERVWRDRGRWHISSLPRWLHQIEDFSSGLIRRHKFNPSGEVVYLLLVEPSGHCGERTSWFTCNSQQHSLTSLHVFAEVSRVMGRLRCESQLLVFFLQRITHLKGTRSLGFWFTGSLRRFNVIWPTNELLLYRAAIFQAQTGRVLYGVFIAVPRTHSTIHSKKGSDVKGTQGGRKFVKLSGRDRGYRGHPRLCLWSQLGMRQSIFMVESSFQKFRLHLWSCRGWAAKISLYAKALGMAK